MKTLFIMLAFALLDFNAPENPAHDSNMYVVKLPYVSLFVSDNGTPEITDDFIFDFDIR